MISTNCSCNRCLSVIIAVAASIIVGIATAFLSITGTITLTTAFLWVVGGIAVAYLAVLLLSSAFLQRNACECACSIINALIIGILGTILFSLVLLAVGIVATSIATAVLAGIVLAFFSLTVTSAALLVRCVFNCRE